MVIFIVSTKTSTVETLLYRTIENAVAAFLLGVVVCLYFLFVISKFHERWDRTNDMLEILVKRDHAYKKLIVKLAKKGINISEDTDENF